MPGHLSLWRIPPEKHIGGATSDCCCTLGATRRVLVQLKGERTRLACSSTRPSVEWFLPMFAARRREPTRGRVCSPSANDETTNLLLMRHALATWEVRDLLLIPPIMFSESAVIKRHCPPKPVAKAKAAGRDRRAAFHPPQYLLRPSSAVALLRRIGEDGPVGSVAISP